MKPGCAIACKDCDPECAEAIRRNREYMMAKIFVPAWKPPKRHAKTEEVTS